MLGLPGFSPCLGAIAVDAGLKLDKILQSALIALSRKLLPLKMFSTVYRDVPLAGTDVVQVPFVPLQQIVSYDFVPADGYTFPDDATLNTRPVTVNKRKYQALAITGYQLARQPVLELEEIIVKKAEQLAEDVIADIFSNITQATYGAAVVANATQGFDSDSVIAVRQACNDAMWPQSGRGLIVNDALDGLLLGDGAIKNAMAFGGSEAIRKGEIPSILGFDYAVAPVFPNNGENLVAVACLPYALLTAFAPIPPPPSARMVMTDYRQVTDDHGLTLEYREWGQPGMDSDYRTIEVNYGAAKGDAAQLKRITG